MVNTPIPVTFPVLGLSVPGASRMFRSGMDTRTRYGWNAAALVYTAFPDSSNTECPGFSSAHFLAFPSDLNAPFCEDASAHDFRTRYQASVSAGAGFGEPPAVPRMPFRMERIFSLVLVYKSGQEKLNNLYYQVKEQRR